jgi:UDP-N-acetylmuramyl pentapeptide phosphotransferase/UDP-N-acetylglucosamine-1-phosphate transferase
MGHFKRLLFERKLTTGAVKAIGGGIVGIAAGWYISAGDPLKWILAAVLIPLASNILNLFDLRPGRAVAVFFIGLGVICIAVSGRIADPWLVGSVAAVTLMFFVMDSKGKAMMGDSGSNTLGAALGLTLVLSTGPIFQLCAIVIIIAVHLYSEKHSLSALIERNGVLRFIDRRLGVR